MRQLFYHSTQWTLTCLLLSFSCQSIAAQDLQKNDVVAKIEKTYGIRIRHRAKFLFAHRHDGNIRATIANDAEVRRYISIFAGEWKKYPTELIKRTKLKTIILCKNLSYARQLRAAIPDFQHDTLFLDVLRGRRDERYVRRVLHHEFYHIIDLRDDGKLYVDERWARLLPKGKRYGTGGKNAQNDRTVGVLTKDTPGFLNRYSMTGVEEDKAEVFAYLIIAPDMMKRRAAKDSVLRAKIKLMKARLTLFCPQLNEGWWRRLAKMHGESKKSNSP